jgi:hydrogenase maturation factor
VDSLRLDAALRQLKFRDPLVARRLAEAIARTVGEIGRSPVWVLHVWGRHELAIAKFGLRATVP